MLASYRSWAAAPCSSCLPCWPLRCRPPTPSPAARPYQPHASADPCRMQPKPASNDAEALQSVVLDAAARAACKLGISREALMLALGDERTRESLGPDAPGGARRGAARRARGRRARRRRGRPRGRAARRRVGARDRRRGARHLAAVQHPRVLEDGGDLRGRGPAAGRRRPPRRLRAQGAAGDLPGGARARARCPTRPSPNRCATASGRASTRR